MLRLLVHIESGQSSGRGREGPRTLEEGNKRPRGGKLFHLRGSRIDSGVLQGETVTCHLAKNILFPRFLDLHENLLETIMNNYIPINWTP